MTKVSDERRTDRELSDMIQSLLNHGEAGYTYVKIDAHLSALRELQSFRSQPEPAGVRVADTDEEDLASDDRWNAGVNYAITQLCEVFGIDPKTINWDAATETLDGDVRSVLCNVLTTAYGAEWSSDKATTGRILSALTEQGEAKPVGVVVAEDDDLRVYWYEGSAISEGDEIYAAPSNPVISDEPTHRHRKRGTEYVLIGIGRMQAEGWIDDAKSRRGHLQDGPHVVGYRETDPVDMREVAIYRRATDPTEIWVRPREQFEDGRFEALTAALTVKPQSGENL